MTSDQIIAVLMFVSGSIIIVLLAYIAGMKDAIRQSRYRQD
jgi:hypothetical protein